MNQMFKVGNRVYCPLMGTKIFTLIENPSTTYPLKFIHESCNEIFTKDGKYNINHGNPSLFRATKENQELLSKLYGTQFEEPKSFLDHHLSLGSKVLCLIAKSSNDLPNKIWEVESDKHFIDVISNRTSGNNYQNDGGSFIKWNYIYPIEVTSTGQINYLS